MGEIAVGSKEESNQVTETTDKNLLIFGMGYSASHFARRMLAKGWSVTGTSRSEAGCAAVAALGATPCHFDGNEAAISDDLKSAIANASHILVSAGPNEQGDPVLGRCGDVLKKADQIGWIGYLSTVGVYGDHDGAWVDETSECRPVTKRNVWRLEAEKTWAEFGDETNKRTQVFRLGGIYGPGSNTLEKLKAGKSRRINKPGQVFSRIHIEDIAATIEAAIERPCEHTIFNVVDNEPAPPQDVIAYGAELLGMDIPPLIHIDDADLTPMARSFYGQNKHVSNARLRQDLGLTLTYPTYREGLRALVGSVKGPEAMATRYRLEGRSFNFSPFGGPIDAPEENKLFFQNLGLAVAAWARMEHTLTILTLHINKEASSKELYDKNPVLVFKKLAELLETWLNKHPEYEDFQLDHNFFEKLRELSDVRNDIIHGSIESINHDDHIVVVSRIKRKGKDVWEPYKITYSLKAFESLLELADLANKQFNVIFENVLKEK